MHKNKLTTPLLIAGLMITCGMNYAAETTPATPDAPKPPARPTTLPPASTKQGVTFATDIKPLFDASCVRCHGAQKPKGNLRLDSLEGVLKGGEDGKILIVGDSAKSKLVVSVARINPKSAMPPEQRGPRRGGPGGPGGNGGEGRTAAGAPPAAGAAADQPAAGAEKAADAPKVGEAPSRPPGGPGGQGGRPQGPPPKPLTAEEVGLVRAWIDQGAK